MVTVYTVRAEVRRLSGPQWRSIRWKIKETLLPRRPTESTYSKGWRDEGWGGGDVKQLVPDCWCQIILVLARKIKCALNWMLQGSDKTAFPLTVPHRQSSFPSSLESLVPRISRRYPSYLHSTAPDNCWWLKCSHNDGILTCQSLVLSLSKALPTRIVQPFGTVTWCCHVWSSYVRTVQWSYQKKLQKNPCLSEITILSWAAFPSILCLMRKHAQASQDPDYCMIFFSTVLDPSNPAPGGQFTATAFYLHGFFSLVSRLQTPSSLLSNPPVCYPCSDPPAWGRSCLPILLLHHHPSLSSIIISSFLNHFLYLVKA